MSNYKNKTCFNCHDKIKGPAYFVRPFTNRKARFKICSGCMLLLDSKGIIDMEKTKIAK